MHHLYDCRCNLADVLYFDRFRKIKLDILENSCIIYLYTRENKGNIMKATQHATNSDLIALMAKLAEEENNAAREYETGEWVSLGDDYCDDFAMEDF